MALSHCFYLSYQYPSEHFFEFTAIEWCGKKEAKRPVQIMLGPGKQIKVQNERGNKTFRTIDLKMVQKLMLEVAPDREKRYCVVKFEREYDLVLKFDDQELRTEFINDFESWLGSPEVGIGRERHEVQESQILKNAVTKGQRKKMLEKFFRVAILQVIW